MKEKERKRVEAEIKRLLGFELGLKGFTAEIERCELTDDHCILFRTAEFQTYPVVFKSLSIYSANSNIIKTEDGYIAIYMCLNIEYKMFDGGCNGTHLANVVMTYKPKDESLSLSMIDFGRNE